MKIYYPQSHYDPLHRVHVFPLLKAFIKPGSYSDAQRLKDYGISEKDFQIVNVVEQADIIILTMSWWYYHNTGKLNKAISFIEHMNKVGFKVWIHIPGDADIDIPKHLKVNTLVQQAYKSKVGKNVFCYPSFIEDPLEKYYQKSAPSERTIDLKPSVGFCGYADSRISKSYIEIFRIAVKNVMYHLGLRPQKPHRLVSNVYKRFKILNKLQKDPRINSNFILRNQYRAGLSNNKSRDEHQSTIDFFENIDNSDYVLCYRGAGNFSIRFYQTLAMGRIPVFVNTDCLLPFENQINWKALTVWIEGENRTDISNSILRFHSNLNNDKMNKLFIRNRALWESHLRVGPFFKNLFMESINN